MMLAKRGGPTNSGAFARFDTIRERSRSREILGPMLLEKF
jgi:hypothetical protein